MREACARVRLRIGVGVAVVAVCAATAVEAVGAIAVAGPKPATAYGEPAGRSPLAAGVSGQCSKATARQLVNAHHLNGFLLPNPVAQLLCGPFTGPGSDAMAVTIGPAPTCWPIQNWAVFRFAQGVWQLVLDQPAYLDGPLVAVGSEIRETTAVHRRGDSRCIPSGGTHARIWRWNGKRLVAGPWKQVKPANTSAPGTGASKSGYFKTPSGNIQCDYGYRSEGDADAYVRCGIKSGLKPPPPSRGPQCDQAPWVTLQLTGPAHPGPSYCPGEDAPDAGPFAGGQAGGRPVSVLDYGKTWRGGGLRCASAFTGLTCRNKSGHGFFLSRERWRSF